VPTVQAVVQSHKIEHGDLLVTLKFNERVPKINKTVIVKWGAKRSLAQNRLYWSFLTWLIEHAGLKDQGHFCPQALHENLKAHFLSEKSMDKGQFKAIEYATTTTLGKSDFGEYMEKINEFMISFFHIDTSGFWSQIER